MTKDNFQPKLGRIRDAKGTSNLRTTAKVFREAGKAGARAVRLRGHISPSSLRRGMGTGALAAAGLIAPGSRRVIVKARYTRHRPGDLGAATAHLRYIRRDGVTREGLPGRLYDASSEDADLDAFLDRSERDPHQFRFMVSPEDSARITDLKPFVRDLMRQMQQDLGTTLDWVAVDHFNTGHSHTHVVIRGKDIERPGPGLALFESGRRRTPLTGKVLAVGLVDEITDRQYVIVDGVDGVDGRVHYADLGRLGPSEAPACGIIVSLISDSLQGKPKSAPRLWVLSPVELAGQIGYDGPTWLDRALIARVRPDQSETGFGAELQQALANRGRWLAEQKLADLGSGGGVTPRPQMMATLRQRETARLADTLSRQLNATHVPHEPGTRISGVYERSVTTPTGKLAVIRREDTFTLAPWKPALDPLRGRAVTGLVQPNRVTWTLDRGRGLPGRSRPNDRRAPPTFSLIEGEFP